MRNDACGSCKQLGSSEETRQAMQLNPDYWLAWYTFKSLALVAAVSCVAYLMGKNAGRKTS